MTGSLRPLGPPRGRPRAAFSVETNSTVPVLFPMLQLTKRTEYGLIALVHMVDRERQLVSVREISEHYPIPRRLLAEVLKDLCRANLVDSQRGATGGYVLAREP